MRRIRQRLAAEESGFTFPELIVAMTIGLIVIGGGMLVLQVAATQQPRASERSARIQQARTLIERVSRELRQGATVQGATATSLTVQTFVNTDVCGGATSAIAISCRITYACASGSCTRSVETDSGPSTSVVAEGILAPEIFSYCEGVGASGVCDLPAATDPTYVGIELGYPREDGGEAITLADGVALRNYLSPGGEQ